MNFLSLTLYEFLSLTLYEIYIADVFKFISLTFMQFCAFRKLFAYNRTFDICVIDILYIPSVYM